MSRDPYTTPGTDIRVPDSGPPRPVRGVLLAFIFDIVGTIIAVNVLSIIYATMLAGQGLSQTEIEQVILSDDMYTPYSLITTLVGLSFSYFSGLLCIRVSRGNTLKYAYWLVGLNVLIGVIVSFSTTEIGLMLVLTILGAIAIVLGAKYALMKQR